MDRGFWIATVVSLAFVLTGCDRDVERPTPTTSRSATGNGIVRGKISCTGIIPVMKTIENVPCHEGAKPIKDETVVVNADPGAPGLRNVLVYLEGPPATDGSMSVPVVMDQKDCCYVPHVVGVQVGQKLVFRSSDPTLHNVHYNPDRNPAANFAFAAVGAEHAVTFAKAGDFIRVKCDVHPWMTGYVGVFDNPWFAVTGEDGAFELSRIPPGHYKLAAWHELYGTKWQEVNVSDEKPIEINMNFTAP